MIRFVKTVLMIVAVIFLIVLLAFLMMWGSVLILGNGEVLP